MVGALEDMTLRLLTVGDDETVSDAVVVAGGGAESELACEGTAAKLNFDGLGSCVSAGKSRFFLTLNSILLLTDSRPLSETFFPTMVKLCEAFVEGTNNSSRKHVSLNAALGRGKVALNFVLAQVVFNLLTAAFDYSLYCLPAERAQ